jgi:hypothetical protein
VDDDSTGDPDSGAEAHAGDDGVSATPVPTRRGRAVVVAVVVALVTAGAVVAFRRPPQPPEGLVILYGDSLSLEAGAAFEAALKDSTDARVELRTVPEVSPCDALAGMREDLALQPSVVVIQYVGNDSSACTRGPGGETLTGTALVERTAADVRAATELFATAGIRVVLVGGPEAPGLPGDAVLDIADAYNDIVNEWAGRDLGRVRYADAAATVTGPDHAYRDRLPCRDDEGGDDGCDGGEVTVRSPDRIHFCPVTHDELVCPVPSPGARRFGEEMARVTRMALGDY